MNQRRFCNIRNSRIAETKGVSIGHVNIGTEKRWQRLKAARLAMNMYIFPKPTLLCGTKMAARTEGRTYKR